MFVSAFLIPHSALRVPNLNQGRDVTVSISACDADCAGANPVALTNFIWDAIPLAEQVLAHCHQGGGLQSRKGWCDSSTGFHLKCRMMTIAAVARSAFLILHFLG